MLATIVAQIGGTPEQGLAGYLQKYGGWGVASVVIVLFIAYYHHQNKLNEKRNDKFIELLQECASILGQAEASHTKLEIALREDKQTLESAQRVLERVERTLDGR